MNVAELAEKLSASQDLSKAQARTSVETIFSEIVNAVHAGEEVSLSGVGKFSLKVSPEREGRNPSNGEKMTIKAQRKIVFSPAKAVKDKLNG